MYLKTNVKIPRCAQDDELALFNKLATHDTRFRHPISARRLCATLSGKAASKNCSRKSWVRDANGTSIHQANVPYV